MIAFRKSLKDLTQYPSAIAGMIMIVGFLVVSVYAMTSIPYNEAIRLWRGGEGVWCTLPRAACRGANNQGGRGPRARAAALSCLAGSNGPCDMLICGGALLLSGAQLGTARRANA